MTTDTRYALYAVSRADIPPGRAAAMCLHAALRLQHDTFTVAMFEAPVVLLVAQNEVHLYEVRLALSFAWPEIAVWYEPDFDHEFAAFAVYAQQPHALARLPLLLEDRSEERDELKEKK